MSSIDGFLSSFGGRTGQLEGEILRKRISTGLSGNTHLHQHYLTGITSLGVVQSSESKEQHYLEGRVVQLDPLVQRAPSAPNRIMRALLSLALLHDEGVDV